MYGLSCSGFRSNHSEARSRSTAGANGRKLSRNLILTFMVACMAGERGSPRMLRTQGPRAELHPPLEPADDLAVGQQGGDVVEQLALVVEPPPGCAVRGQGSLDFVGREARAEEAPLLGIAAVGPSGVVQELMPDEQGRPQRTAGIAGRRLDPDVVEVALAEQPAVGHAVERHPAGQDQVLHPGLPAPRAGRSGARPPRSRPGCWRPGPCAAAPGGPRGCAAGRRTGGGTAGRSSSAPGSS